MIAVRAAQRSAVPVHLSVKMGNAQALRLAIAAPTIAAPVDPVVRGQAHHAKGAATAYVTRPSVRAAGTARRTVVTLSTASVSLMSAVMVCAAHRAVSLRTAQRIVVDPSAVI